MSRRKRGRSGKREDPRDIPVILEQVGSQGGHPEWRRTTWYARNGGAPMIHTEYYDNQDDPGRPPAYHETTSMPLAEFLASTPKNAAAVVTYHRLVAEGYIEGE